MKAIEISYPKHVLGIVGAAGFAAAASTASALVLVIVGFASSNIYKIAKPTASDGELVMVRRAFSYSVQHNSYIARAIRRGRLVPLLLLGYAGITQMFPGAVVGMFWKKANK